MVATSVPSPRPLVLRLIDDRKLRASLEGSGCGSGSAIFLGAASTSDSKPRSSMSFTAESERPTAFASSSPAGNLCFGEHPHDRLGVARANLQPGVAPCESQPVGGSTGRIGKPLQHLIEHGWQHVLEGRKFRLH